MPQNISAGWKTLDGLTIGIVTIATVVTAINGAILHQTLSQSAQTRVAGISCAAALNDAAQGLASERVVLERISNDLRRTTRAWQDPVHSGGSR